MSLRTGLASCWHCKLTLWGPVHWYIKIMHHKMGTKKEMGLSARCLTHLKLFNLCSCNPPTNRLLLLDNVLLESSWWLALLYLGCPQVKLYLLLKHAEDRPQHTTSWKQMTNGIFSAPWKHLLHKCCCTTPSLPAQSSCTWANGDNVSKTNSTNGSRRQWGLFNFCQSHWRSELRGNIKYTIQLSIPLAPEN